MRTPAQLRRDLQEIVDDLPRVLAQDLTAEERREYERAGRRARLRLFWLRPLEVGERVIALHRYYADGRDIPGRIVEFVPEDDEEMPGAVIVAWETGMSPENALYLRRLS